MRVCIPHSMLNSSSEIWYPPPVAVVGLSQTTYQVDEDAGDVEVCVEVKATSRDCIILFPFIITLTTVDNTGS